MHRAFEGDLKCMFNNDNATKLVLQVRLLRDQDGEKDDDEGDEDIFFKKIEQKLLEVNL